MQISLELDNNINDVLEDFGMPEFGILPEINSISDMIDRLIDGYHKEVYIQSIWGGIRNPSAVLQNKIRHELTNYDEVRDALTRASNNGMDKTLVMDIREELLNMSYQLCEVIIDILPHTISVKDNNRGWIEISKQQLRRSNKNYWQKELNYIYQEKNRL